MKTSGRTFVIWLVAGIVGAGLLPIILYWTFYLRPTSLPIDAAHSLLAQSNSTALLADVRSLSVWKQWLAVATGFVIKPTHMVLCLALIVWLWPQRSPDLVALRWGLIIFWLGEASCAENYLFCKGRSELWEYLHNYGMSIGFAFAAYALLEGLDRRIIKYSPAKERCAALSLCRACIKYADVPCGLRRLFHLLIPASILVAIIPLCVRPEVISYDVTVLGTLTNYSHLLPAQLYETWYCSALAVVLLTVSWLVLCFKRDDPVALSKIFFAGAMGSLGFGLFRLFLYSVYRDELLWAALWEEVTELLFVASVGFVLWVFRDSLFMRQAPAAVVQSSPQQASA
jgi:hypothetical protein